MKHLKFSKTICYIMTMFIIAGIMFVTSQSVARAASKEIKITNISGTTKSVQQGKKFTIKTNYSSSKLKMKSSNTSVASVSEKGVVTAKKVGTAKISLVLKGDEKIKKIITIKVKKKKKIYSNEELCRLSKEYYRKMKGYEPPIAEVDGVEGDIVTIHLFEIMGDHTATCDWYYISRKTGKGSNLLGQEVDLTKV